MSVSVIYRNATLYELTMLALYGRYYTTRNRVVAELIPAQSTVLDLCCGPGRLYSRFLKPKSVEYTGLDINPRFVKAVDRKGGRGLQWDLRSREPLPRADFVVMQASLYHFLPNPEPLVERMLVAARDRVIIAEPVRNLGGSRWRLVSFMGRSLTNAGKGAEALRFNQVSLDRLLSRFCGRIERSFLIPGGREKVFLLRAGERN